jgi:hypothetical protein
MSPIDRTLRWYPREWRDRYGEELVGLLEDTYGQGPVPVRCRLSLVKAGVLERLRGPGRARDRDGFRERVRSGSLLVLCAWAVFIVAGAGFAKFAEHWDLSTPSGERRLPATAYDTVQWAALAGSLIVLAAAVLCAPALVRLVRGGGWTEVRRPVLRAGLAAAVTVACGSGVVIWAGHLSDRERNGGMWLYSSVWVVWALMIGATIALGVAAAVTVVRRIRLGGPVLRVQGVLALSMTLLMAVITGGTLAWWISVARVAPRFWDNGSGGSTLSLVPPMMTIAGLLMVSGLAAAFLGARWVAGALPRLAADPEGPDAPAR